MATRVCPHCGETIQAAAIKCRFCAEAVDPVREELPPASPPRSATEAPSVFGAGGWAARSAGEKLGIIAMSIILGGAMLAWAINDSEKRVNGTPPKADVAPPAPPTDDDTGDAEQIIQETIATPSTAKYQSSTVVASEGAYRMVNVIVDAQNNFGAMLRKSLCVTYFRDGTKIRWTKSFGVQECSKPPTSDEIAILKGLNDWPKAGATKRPTAQ